MSGLVLGETWTTSGDALAETIGRGVTYDSDPDAIVASVARRTGFSVRLRSVIRDPKTDATSWRFDVVGFASDDEARKPARRRR